jgi:sortase (surface protein transpeptidase)
MSVETTRKQIQNHLLPGVVLVIIVIGLALLIPKQAQMPTEGMGTKVEPSGPALTEAMPTKLTIPKLNIETTFEEPLGLASDGAIEIPDSYTQVGWYEHGPTPGEYGPAVILGHVDSVSGPAVFFSLGQLEAGDDITIDRADGRVAHFKVEKLERYEQTAFPTAKVYGDIDHAGLRLITCSGFFKKGEQRYTHNLVVYAKLVE